MKRKLRRPRRRILILAVITLFYFTLTESVSGNFCQRAWTKDIEEVEENAAKPKKRLPDNGDKSKSTGYCRVRTIKRRAK